MKILLIIAGLVGIWVIVSVLLSLTLTRRLKRLAATRDTQQNFLQFKTAFADFPETFLLPIYDAVSDLIAVKDFPIHPDDDFWKTYQVDDGDFTDAFESLLKQLRKQMPADSRQLPIDTVRDLVRFLYYLPNVEEQK